MNDLDYYKDVLGLRLDSPDSVYFISRRNSETVKLDLEPHHQPQGGRDSVESADVTVLTPRALSQDEILLLKKMLQAISVKDFQVQDSDPKFSKENQGLILKRQSFAVDINNFFELSKAIETQAEEKISDQEIIKLKKAAWAQLQIFKNQIQKGSIDRV